MSVGPNGWTKAPEASSGATSAKLSNATPCAEIAAPIAPLSSLNVMPPSELKSVRPALVAHKRQDGMDRLAVANFHSK